MVLPLIPIAIGAGILTLLVLVLFVAFIFLNPWAAVAMFGLGFGGIVYYFTNRNKKRR